MAESPGTDERLPWLESPRPSAKARATKAARRARRPLLILLGLFAATTVAIMSFLAGRGSDPLNRMIPRTPSTIVAPLPPARVPSAPVAAGLPATTTAASSESVKATTSAASSGRSKAATPRNARARAHVNRANAARRAAMRKARRSLIPDIVIHRNATPTSVPSVAATVPQRSTNWPAQPFAGAPGKVIQLGSFRTMAQADAAWWRLARVYPYLGTLPRVVTYVGPTPGRARIYHLRLAAGSRREARALCRNLHRIGRGCGIV